MNGTFGSAAWPACHSALRLDRWMAGELPPAEADTLAAHVAGCGRCRAAVATLEEARDRTALPPLRLPAAPAAGRPRPGWRTGLAAAALAAGVAGAVLLVRPPADGAAAGLKGASPALTMYVQHAGEVRRAGVDEQVAPGDAVRFAVSLRAPAYVAVLTLDPAGRASVYYPAGPRAEPVQPGTEVALPLATRLDETRGREQVFGLFCDRPVELDPVRARLDALAAGLVPPGCQVTRWSFEKR